MGFVLLLFAFALPISIITVYPVCLILFFTWRAKREVKPERDFQQLS